MRIYAVLCTVVLLAAQSVATFAQLGMGGTGLYGSLDVGANLVGDASKVKAKHGLGGRRTPTGRSRSASASPAAWATTSATSASTPRSPT